MKKVFVSGCYDILHGGHIQFFEDAKALGDHLTVCFASGPVLEMTKKRKPSLPDEHKKRLIEGLACVDKVVSSSDLDTVFDFLGHWKEDRPDILAITEDDKNVDLKNKVCAEYGVELVVLPKRNGTASVSTTSILAGIKKVSELPLRVDFAGGWLDVPRLSRKGAFIVNCAITPKVSLARWPYEKGAGLGGPAAYALLQVKDGVRSELDLGVGWQDPAIIDETGLCVWRSGKTPVLEAKYNPDWLDSKMLIVWTNATHNTPAILSNERDYDLIEKASATAAKAVAKKDLRGLARAISMSYKAQLGEGMKPLPAIKGSLARKYLGGGHGGYALYVFETKKGRDAALKKAAGSKAVEPYIKSNG
ncbi:MAG: adenylyltransferase/cytidyltransferase family protein [Patescibacteria group bacterium]|nr:adenylyltransferase/cytidyltransferase family protein [Patescibacteria group bacterium]